MAENRRRLLDPCHSKVLNITNLQIARMKLKIKLELRALKKITDEALRDGGNSVVVLPADVYENPLETIPNQFHEGIIGHYGSATEDQLKAFFGDTLAKPMTVTKGNSTKANDKPKLKPTSAPVTPIDYNPVPYTDDEMELQNAIRQICPGSNDMQVDGNEFLMENADQECVLFDLS